MVKDLQVDSFNGLLTTLNMPSRYQVFALDRTFNCSDVNKNQKAETVNLKVFDNKFLQVTDKLYHIMLKRTFISKMDPLVTMSVFTLYFLYL
jgi:hypothetical protein